MRSPELDVAAARCSLKLSKEVALACVQREILILRRVGHGKLAEALLAPMADIAAVYDNALEQSRPAVSQAPGEHS